MSLSDTSLFLLGCVVLQVERGKLHGNIDVGLSVMTIKKKSQRIDLDTEDNIYHLKVKDTFNKINSLQI